VHFGLLALANLRNALVLVAPNDQVEEVGDLALEDAFVPGSVVDEALELVLVQHQDVEPVVPVLVGSLELDGFVLEGEIESLLRDVAEAVERDLGLALDE